MLINKIIVFLFNWSILAVNCKKRQFRTFAGQERDIKKVPYTAYVSVGCTGALVSPQWVLTAANCFVGIDFQNITIGLGTSDKDQSYFNVGIENVYIYPKYLNDTSDLLGARHDIALVKLVTPILISKSMQVLEIEKSAWPSHGNRLCTLAGYGQNMDKDTKLHFSVLSVTQGCDCIEDSEIICAKILKDGDDSPCFGDAGSVLVCDNKGVAVTSHGISTSYCGNPRPENSSHTMLGCARNNTYFLFTAIQPHLKWFRDLIPREAHGYLYSNANRHTMKSIQHYDIITSVHLFGLIIIFSSHFY